jgi:hypothetical protein
MSSPEAHAEHPAPESWRGEDRRNETRTRVEGLARLKVVDPLMSVGPPLQVRVLDVSTHGLKLQVPSNIFTGSLVQIHQPQRILFAQVRYCHPAGPEFQIGVHLKDVFMTDGNRSVL